jgi:HlyD family secretion protein
MMGAAPKPKVKLKPGQKREETEGVFVIRDGKATFVSVDLGIAGERYLEVLSGLKEGDRVITGPFESVRGMFEGDAVTTGDANTASASGGSGVRVRVGG